MLVNEKVRIQLPSWLQSYKDLRLKQQMCLERIRNLSAALYKSKNKASIVRNLVEYRRWLDFLKSLENEMPKMRFTDERQWQYGGHRSYYPVPKQLDRDSRPTRSVKLPKLKFHQVAKQSHNINRANTKPSFKLPADCNDKEASIQVTFKTERSSQSDHSSDSSMLHDLRNSLERQETIPSKLSPRNVINLPKIESFSSSVQ